MYEMAPSQTITKKKKKYYVTIGMISDLIYSAVQTVRQ